MNAAIVCCSCLLSSYFPKASPLVVYHTTDKNNYLTEQVISFVISVLLGLGMEGKLLGFFSCYFSHLGMVVELMTDELKQMCSHKSSICIQNVADFNLGMCCP